MFYWNVRWISSSKGCSCRTFHLHSQLILRLIISCAGRATAQWVLWDTLPRRRCWTWVWPPRSHAASAEQGGSTNGTLPLASQSRWSRASQRVLARHGCPKGGRLPPSVLVHLHFSHVTSSRLQPLGVRQPAPAPIWAQHLSQGPQLSRSSSKHLQSLHRPSVLLKRDESKLSK